MTAMDLGARSNLCQKAVRETFYRRLFGSPCFLPRQNKTCQRAQSGCQELRAPAPRIALGLAEAPSLEKMRP